MMKTFAVSLVLTLAAAFAFQMVGAWWAMPLAGGMGGYWVKRGRPGFLVGALGVTLVWGAFLAVFAAVSPVGGLLRLFAGITEIGETLAFAPVVLALVAAALMGGLGGLSGALIAGVVSSAASSSA